MIHEMSKISVAIEPELKLQFGPEIEWTLRIILTGIGWAWEEVEINERCNLAYTSHPERTVQAGVIICATPQYWRNPSVSRLKAVNRANGTVHLVFQGEENESFVLESELDRLIIHRDILFDIFWLLTGQEEIHFSKDKHGFMDLSGNPYLSENIMQEATASQIRVWLS